MRRSAIRAALLVGVMVLAVEGYFLYSFYSEPAARDAASEGRPTERREETGNAGPAAELAERTERTEREGTGTRPEAGESPAAEEYLEEVGALQAEAVETLDDSGEKLLRYDTLTAHDVEVMENNRAALGQVGLRAQDLDAPEEYADHHELFVSAVGTMREASEVAHRLAADPVDATRSGFEEYRRLVKDADALLMRSNGMIGRDYETVRTTEGEEL